MMAATLAGVNTSGGYFLSLFGGVIPDRIIGVPI